ncbi:unnamed protein product [Haemonchus placei]|uniref:MSP domain-containing protein n=1 Tax=Haemonchus placei TaxID=6290 RepID=A0A0N4WX37_HAEPC|nr:unnamed protein product [Haemonchus placei]
MFGGATSSSVEAFNVTTPNEVIVPDFNNGRRLRVVVVPLTTGDRFEASSHSFQPNSVNIIASW